jgi:hypothetical protein
VLRDDRGNEYRPTILQEPSGGQYVSGLLQFSDADPILQPDVSRLERELQGIAGVPSRDFEWKLAQ